MRPQALKALSIAALAGLLVSGASADKRDAPVRPGPSSPSGDIGDSFCRSGRNSTGQAARITAQGSLSLSDNDLRLIVTGVPVNEFFAVVHGRSTTMLPFGNGVLCVSGHTVIGRPRISVADTVEMPVNVNASMLVPGNVYFQCWFRDRAAGRVQYDSSDGVHVQFLP